jgi:MYXO-CTERM domain-containing protein
MRCTTCLLRLLLLAAVAPAHAVELQVGDWVVADPDANTVYRVDPDTGDKTPISQDGLFRYPSGVALDALGRVLVADPDANAVFRVDPETGAQSVVSSGASFRFPTGIAVDQDDFLLVADPDADAVFRVHPVTGVQTLDTLAADTGAIFATGAIVEASGHYALADPDFPALLRWDPDLAAATTVSSADQFEFPTDVTADDDGDLLVADPAANGFVRVDPISGIQTPVGPADAFLYPTGIAFVPEPGAPWQLGTGLLALAGLARRSRRRVRLRNARPAGAGHPQRQLWRGPVSVALKYRSRSSSQNGCSIRAGSLPAPLRFSKRNVAPFRR